MTLVKPGSHLKHGPIFMGPLSHAQVGILWLLLKSPSYSILNLSAFSGEMALSHLLGFSFEPVLIRSIRKTDGRHGQCVRAIGNV